MDGEIRVLHVDDNEAFRDIATEFLEREFPPLTVTHADTADAGLARLEAESFDCVVSDYDMPERNGIEFLEEVTDRFEQMPFILFTGQGSEEIASEAISAGVTDYVQKTGSPEQFSILANRIRNAVETMRAQRTAQQAQEQLKLLSEGFPDIAFYIDEEGRYVDFIAGEESPLLHSEAETMQKRRMHDLLPDAVADRFMRTVNAVLETGEMQTVEYELSVQTGTEWFEARVAPLETETDPEMVLWVARKVTEQKERERALETLHDVSTTIQAAETVEEACEQTVEAAEDVLSFEMCTTLIREGEWLVPYAVSDGAPENGSRQMRIDQGLAGKTYQTGESYIVDDIADDDDTDPATDRYRSGLSVPVGEQGVFQAVNTETETFSEQDKALAELLISHTEQAIERIQHERDLTKQKDRLDDFASLISHDLRNPLNVAGLRLDLARQEVENPHLADVEQALSRMEQLIDDLLVLARQGEAVGQRQPVQIDQIVTDCWQNVETADGELNCELSGNIRADESRLASVLENLFRNALEHGGDDVTISVGLLPDGLYVADDGPGIPSEDRKHVFESGYSTTDEGTGFGLAIVKEVVEGHGWEITVTESAHGGARFEIVGVDSLKPADQDV